MTIEDVRAAYDEDERRQAFEPSARWITAGGCAAFWSPVYRAGWSLQAPPDDDAGIAALRDAVKRAVLEDDGAEPADASGEFEWKCFSWDGQEAWYADAALQAAGFAPRDAEAVVYADVTTLSTESAADAFPPEVTIRVATGNGPDDAAILADADAVNAAVWDESTRPSAIAAGYWSPGGPRTADPAVDAAAPGAAAPDASALPPLPHLSIHVAYLDGCPVSYGRFQVTPGSRFGGLWGGATVADARGRGCYRALVANRAAEAHARGLTWLMVDANPETSYPILRRLGFDLLGHTRPYVFPLGAA